MKIFLNRKFCCLRTRMDFNEVIKHLNDVAPLKLAENWDNVGLLVEPADRRAINRLLLTNDLTLDVMDEAVEKQVDFILSYHPPIFKPLKSVTLKHWKGEIVSRCLSRGIAVYSPHTALDSVRGGINDWLISPFSENAQSISNIMGDFEYRVDIYSEQCGFITDSFDFDPSLVKQKIRFLTPYGETGSLFSVLVSSDFVETLISTLVKCDCKFAVSKCEKVSESYGKNGVGRKAELKQQVSMTEALSAIKKHLQLKHVRLAKKRGYKEGDAIKSVAVCAGAGSSVLRDVTADLLITGESSHHDVLEMTHRGCNVVLVDHSNSERGFLSAVLKPRLEKLFSGRAEVLLSEKDADPLQIV